MNAKKLHPWNRQRLEAREKLAELERSFGVAPERPEPLVVERLNPKPASQDGAAPFRVRPRRPDFERSVEDFLAGKRRRCAR